MNPPTQFSVLPDWERELQARSGIPGQSLPRHLVAPAKLPSLESKGLKLDPSACVEPCSSIALGLAITFWLIVVGVALVASREAIFGVAFFAGLVFVVEYLAGRRARTILRASALRVGPGQFQEIHDCVKSFANRLSMSELPEVYVFDAAEVNGFALKLGRKNGIFLTDEAVAGCLEGRSPGALAFVIGHEMAHLALGHQLWWRRPLRRLHWLSRLDECSADNVACELVGSSEAAQDGVLLLAAGPRLLSFVNREAARTQAAEIGSEKAVRRVERSLTHPLTLHRLDRVVKRFPAAKLGKAA